MARYQRDPRWITARFAGQCARTTCQAPITKGEQIYWYPATKSAYCQTCGRDCEADFEAHRFDEESGTCPW